MDAGSSHTTVWKDGRLQDASRAGGSLASLCAAIEQAVNAHRASGTSVRAVILMLDEAPAAPHAHADPTHVFVDVYDSGFGPDAGYGHGI